MAQGEKIIGIDLGTTNSVVAVVEGGEPKVIPNPEGSRLTPSVVAFTKDAETIVGEPARRQAVTNPTKTIYSIKRFMGRRHNEVSSEEKMVPYKVIGSGAEYVKVQVGDKEYTPQEISAQTLRKLKESAESYLGHKVNKAVITVPAYFNDAQRQATKDAGQVAGLEVARIINEPTAAAMAYGLEKATGEQKIVVFDLGGGTFDVSVLELTEDDGKKIFEVISTSGDTRLGGDDFDEALINHVADGFKAEHGIDLRENTMALQRLQEACEKAKKELSTLPQTELNLAFICQDENNQPLHLQPTITRIEFEKMTEGLITRCKKPLEQALKDAGLKASEIDEIVLVGGSTRIPKVQELVKDFFGKEPHRGVNPDEVVAIGAAIQGSVLAGDRKDVLLLDVTPLTLGIETEHGIMTALVERNTTIPAKRKETFSTAANNQTEVHIRVFQGERKMANDNRLLGDFNLTGIPPAPRGVPKIEVSFDIDQNGILSVSAKDLGTGKEANVTIKDSSGLSDDEIDQMQKDAEANAEEDKKKFELATARNKAGSMTYEMEKTLEEMGDKLQDSDKEPIQKAIDKAKEATEGEDVDAINTAVKELEEVAHAMSAAMYANDSAEGEASPEESASSDNDDAIDAEFEVKSDS